MTLMWFRCHIPTLTPTQFNGTLTIVYARINIIIFMITDYSTKISFTGNYAQRGVGHHMYGASIRDDSCSIESIIFVNKQGKPHRFYHDDKPDSSGYVKIFSLDPGLNKILSPVSSAPQRVCLCDSNGKPQCASSSIIHFQKYQCLSW